ncbi:MAG: hypothetical protein AAGD06_03865 [Acidobacteriota bacterium]
MDEHLDDETFLQLACGELDAFSERAARRHIERCDACREIWDAVAHVQAAAVEFDPGAIAPSSPGPALARPESGPVPVPRSPDAGGPPGERPAQVPGRRRGLRPWWLGLAAAAALAVVMVGRGPAPVVDPPLHGGDPVERSASGEVFEDLTPDGPVAVTDVGFAWRPVPTAIGYSLELLDGLGERLWVGDGFVEPSAPWPPSVPREVGLYFWRVTAHFSGAESPRTSELVAFELVAPGG